ncbi:DUF948 domain-containing protein [Rosettibacter firmus]|uniref:DUF948 domain-containing protein n=1 Tax=Rosettibacter firmus TaxID=3111522 RepID=UPI00336C2B56
MDIVINILLVILIISASVLCIYLIFTLKSLIREAEAIRKDVHDIVEKALPVLENLNDVSNRASRVVSDIENYWEEVDSSIKKIKEKIANFTSLKTFQGNDNPAKDFIKNLRALFKGISTFWQTFKKK